MTFAGFALAGTVVARRLCDPRLRTAAFYLAASAVPAAANFAMTLLLVRRLGTEGFAVWAALEPFLAIGALVLTMGAQWGGLNQVATGRSGHGAAMGALLTMMAFTAPTFGLLALPLLMARLGSGMALALWACCFAEALALVVNALFRAHRQAAFMAAAEGGRNSILVVVTALCVVLALPWMVDVTQLLWTRAAISLAVLAGLVILRLRPEKFGRGLATSILLYGLPLFVSHFLDILLNNADRYVVLFAGMPPADLTAYVVHLRLAGLLNLAVLNPLGMWFPVEAMRRDTRTEREFFVGVLAVALALVLTLTLLVVLAAPLFWSALFPGVPLRRGLLLACTGAVAIQGISAVFVVGQLRPGYTGWASVAPLVGGLVIVMIGFGMTRHFGVLGLAVARMLAMAAYAITMRIISQRIAPIQTSARKLVPFALAICALAFVPSAARYGNGGLVLAAAVVLAAVAFGVAFNFRAIRSLRS